MINLLSLLLSSSAAAATTVNKYMAIPFGTDAGLPFLSRPALLNVAEPLDLLLLWLLLLLLALCSLFCPV